MTKNPTKWAFFRFGTKVEIGIGGYENYPRTSKGKVSSQGGGGMVIEVLAILLIILWLVGLALWQGFGGLLNAILFLAVVIFVFRLITGRRVA